jgi:ribosomal protein L7Ae-like RNA K-turn-binding protein
MVMTGEFPDGTSVLDGATEQRIFGLIGLGIRARNAVVGVERVRDAARRGRLALAVVAQDASHNSTDKVLPLLRARRVPVVAVASAVALGESAGRGATTAIGITDRSLAAGMRALVAPRTPQARVTSPLRAR